MQSTAPLSNSEKAQNCQLSDAYTNALILQRNTWYREVFGDARPNKIKGHTLQDIERKSSKWEAELHALLALSAYYSATADEPNLRALTSLIMSHPVYHIDPNVSDQGRDWHDGKEWLSREAYLAVHHLQIWHLSRDMNDLEQALLHTKRQLADMDHAWKNDLPPIFGAYWKNNQAIAAEEVQSRLPYLLGRVVATAKIAAPELLEGAGLSPAYADDVLEKFAKALRFSSAWITESAKDNAVIADDSALPTGPTLDSWGASELNDIVYWQGVLKLAGRSPHEASTFPPPASFDAQYCYQRQEQALRAIHSIEHQALLPRTEEHVNAMKQTLQAANELLSHFKAKASADGAESLVGYARAQQLLKAMSRDYTLQNSDKD